jgi:cob(I)alamin adenosyltransferase
VVLDEINTLLHFKIIAVERVLRLLAEKPEALEVVLTGRYAPAEILARADLITEMLEIRHYYQKNISARTGIEK